MNLILFDHKAELVKAWSKTFGGQTGNMSPARRGWNVSYVQGDLDGFEDCRFDALVSPANSFGLMDGGIDLAYTQRYGEQLGRRVRRHNELFWSGIQPVGTAIIVPLKDDFDQVPYLVHAPTMMVPSRVVGMANVYLAFKAVLEAVEAHNLGHRDEHIVPHSTRIDTILCPGLGTGVGKVSPESAAAQMAVALRHVSLGARADTWRLATRYCEEIEDAVHR